MRKPPAVISTTDSSTERPIASAISGILYAAFVVAMSAGMLFVNALFCLTIYSAIPIPGGEQIASRVGQMFYFIAPILLLVVEWNLIDRLYRLFHRSAT